MTRYIINYKITILILDNSAGVDAFNGDCG